MGLGTRLGVGGGGGGGVRFKARYKKRFDHRSENANEFSSHWCDFHFLKVFLSRVTRTRTRNTWDWIRVWKIVFFCTATRFCDIKQTRNCLLLLAVAFMNDDNNVSHPLVRGLVRSGSRF